jgi:polyhydroxybutyrate depolymerase
LRYVGIVPRSAGLGAAIVILIIGACATAAPSTVSSPPTSVPATDAPSGSPARGATSTPHVATVGGDRPASVHLPSQVPGGPAPLIVLLHGYGASAAEIEDYFRLGPVAAARGIVLAAPEGTVDSEGRRFWNATDACCDLDGTGIDDVGYLAGLIEEIKTVASVDPRRIYLVGHSNGGFMSYRMACEHADVVAAIVSLAGASLPQRDDCRPTEPVAVLQIHGTADDVIKFDGGDLSDLIGGSGPSRTYPGARESATAWAAYDGCARELVEADDTVDVDALLSGPSGPAETKVARATGCEPGGHVELWTIPDGSHVPSVSGAFADEVVGFLLDHPKP